MMLEYNLLDGYPSPDNPRIVGENLRQINHRIIASKRGKEFFDGDRNFGYGGYKYDGRWKSLASKLCKEYLNQNSNFLQINCEKGFLLNDIKTIRKDINIYGTETSNYAIENSMSSVKKNISKQLPYDLTFNDNYFEFVIALGVVYTQTLDNAIKVLKEIVRVSKGKSFITLATYKTEEEFFLFRDWTLLGVLMFKREEWIEILRHVNYRGFYYFTDSNSLNLTRI